MVGHACLRTLELLRAPSLLHDYHHLEQSLGEVLPRMGLHYERALPRWLQLWLYRHALERGSCEALLLWAGQAWNRMVGLLDQFDHAVERVLSGSQEEDSL